jgi:hypothetical protein
MVAEVAVLRPDAHEHLIDAVVRVLRGTGIR